MSWYMIHPESSFHTDESSFYTSYSSFQTDDSSFGTGYNCRISREAAVSSSGRCRSIMAEEERRTADILSI